MEWHAVGVNLEQLSTASRLAATANDYGEADMSSIMC